VICSVSFSMALAIGELILNSFQQGSRIKRGGRLPLLIEYGRKSGWETYRIARMHNELVVPSPLLHGLLLWFTNARKTCLFPMIENCPAKNKYLPPCMLTQVICCPLPNYQGRSLQCASSLAPRYDMSSFLSQRP
jgi:hypothetical protein